MHTHDKKPILPCIADYVTTQVNNALGSAGTNAGTLGIDHNWKGVIGYTLFGAACAWAGFIHSTNLRFFLSGSFNFSDPSFNATWGPVGYLAMAVLFVIMMNYSKNNPAPKLED